MKVTRILTILFLAATMVMPFAGCSSDSDSGKGKESTVQTENVPDTPNETQDQKQDQKQDQNQSSDDELTTK